MLAALGGDAPRIVSVDCEARQVRGPQWALPSEGGLVPVPGSPAEWVVVVPQWWNGLTNSLEQATLSRLDLTKGTLSAPFYIGREHDLHGVVAMSTGWVAALDRVYDGRGTVMGSATRCIAPSGATRSTPVEGLCAGPFGAVATSETEVWGLLSSCPLRDRWTRIVRWEVGQGCTQIDVRLVDEDAWPTSIDLL
jgi:hypothetical protein